MAADASAAILVLGEVFNSKRALNSARPSSFWGLLLAYRRTNTPLRRALLYGFPHRVPGSPLGQGSARGGHLMPTFWPSNRLPIGASSLEVLTGAVPRHRIEFAALPAAEPGHRSRHRVWRLNAPLAPIAGPSGNPEMRLHRPARPAIDWEDILGTRREGDDEIHFRTQPHVAARQRLRRCCKFEPTV